MMPMHLSCVPKRHAANFLDSSLQSAHCLQLSAPNRRPIEQDKDSAVEIDEAGLSESNRKVTARFLSCLTCHLLFSSMMSSWVSLTFLVTVNFI